MSIFDYLQFIFAITATIGSLFCCLGAFTLNNKTIAFMTMGSYGPNQFAVKNIAEQRAQYIAGAFFFIFSFFVFLISVAFQDFLKSQNIECVNFLKISTILVFLFISIATHFLVKLSSIKTVEKINNMKDELSKDIIRLSEIASEQEMAKKASKKCS